MPCLSRLARHAVFAAPMLLIARPALAAQQDEQAWFQINTALPLARDWKITFEQIGRFSDQQHGLYQTELGGIVDRRLSPHVAVGFGYRWVAAYNGNTAANEHRIRQHIVYTDGPFYARLRVDERFNPGGREVGFRIRPLLRYTYKLGTGGWALFVSHESFYLPNETRWGQHRGYDRMRNAVGVSIPLSNRVSSDIGYLNEYRFGHAGARDIMNHAITMQLSINLTEQHAHHADD